MDLKRLIEFVLLGGSGLEQYALLLVRVSLGLFVAISEANKLFVAGGTKPVYETLVKAKVPFPHHWSDWRIDYLYPEPLERPAPGNVLVCCSQPNTGVTLDL